MSNFWQSVQTRLVSLGSLLNFSAMIFLQIGVIVLASFWAADSLRNEVACDWAKILVTTACPAPEKGQKVPLVSAVDQARIAIVDWSDPKQLIRRANEQFETIQLRKRLHLEMLVGFFKAYSWSILAVLFAAPFAAIAVLLLGQGGLAGASPALKATFFATTITASVAAAIPAVFGHQSSISANQALFLAYEDLGNQIKTFYDSGYRAKELSTAAGSDGRDLKRVGLVTSCEAKDAKTIDSTQKCAESLEDIRKFLAYVDYEMKRLNQIAIAIDSSKIPAFTINPGKG